jgi:uncharacterized protein YodC (DUF2158 family)
MPGSFSQHDTTAAETVAYCESLRKPPIAVGSVVRLKSGGPEMTVDRIGPSGPCIHCCYFETDIGGLRVVSFYPAELEVLR